MGIENGKRNERFLDRDVFEVLGGVIRAFYNYLDDPKRKPDDPKTQGLTRHAHTLAERYKKQWPPEA